MLKISFVEVLLRLIPECLIYMLAAHSFSGLVINKNRFLITSVLMGVSGYIFRQLPINFGVHTALNLMVFVMLLVYMHKLEMTKAISAAGATIVLAFGSEALNMVLLQNILRLDVKYIFSQPLLKSFAGLPSLIILGSIAVINYNRLLKRNKLSQR